MRAKGCLLTTMVYHRTHITLRVWSVTGEERGGVKGLGGGGGGAGNVPEVFGGRTDHLGTPWEGTRTPTEPTGAFLKFGMVL